MIDRPQGITAPITQRERTRRTLRFSDMGFPQLLALFAKRDMGYLDDWADFVEYIFRTDTDMAGLAATRTARVTQADWKVIPNAYGDPALAKDAADFCREMVARIENWHETVKHMLQAVFGGAAFAEKEWDEDGSTRTNFIRRCNLTHAHRFRYDEQWLPRLYDQGARQCEEPTWGETLDPARWIVHHHYEISGYPNVAGIMAPASVTWLYKRIVEKYYAGYTERSGDPFVWAEIAQETNSQMRAELELRMEQMLLSKIGFVEKGGALHFEHAPGESAGQTAHSVYLDRANAALAKLFLGSSDVVDPGENGSKAAVGVRAGATMDPKMVDDGLMFAGTVQRDVLYWFCAMNRHKFGGRMPPVPTYEAVTASDEVQTDLQDLQQQTPGAEPIQITSGQPAPKALPPPASALRAAAATSTTIDPAISRSDVPSLLKIVSDVASGNVPRASAAQLIKLAYGLDDAATEALLADAGDVACDEPEPKDDGGAEPDPKARRRSSKRRNRQSQQMTLTHTQSAPERTLPTSTGSASKLAAALRGE